MSRGRSWRLATRAARAGKSVDLAAGVPASTPIVASSGFEQPDATTLDEIFAGERRGYVYGRYHNPTVDALEQSIAGLEEAGATAAYGSGMGAIAGAFAALDLAPGARVLAARDLYGTTITWLEDRADKSGWELERFDASSRAAATELIARRRPDVVYCETLSNPLVRLVDVDAVAGACSKVGAALILDATFTPPPLLQPLRHGATLVVHSATKYLGGHGDLVAGVLSGAEPLVERAKQRRKLDGTIVDPFTAWLLLRGLRTLPVRISRQCANARAIARHLAGRSRVTAVHYPGIGLRDTDDERELLGRLFPHGDHGAMLSFEIAGQAAAARRFLDALELWGRAPTLGDLDSLALVPAMTSHRHVTPEQRAEMGISESTVRLSVGVEAVEDLIEDLDRALDAI